MSEQIITTVPDMHLKFAQADDVPQILRFIRQLAEFEQRAEQVRAGAAARA